ncbi:conserved hypothetical protein, membrane [Candidatus Magnetomorum sp. HK-1]|nr:conserved hypothetical protein, membrane [Candidatus Magnetomorum sp. HK-1]
MTTKSLIWLKERWELIIKSNDNPNEIALGLSIGVFSGILPILGFQTLFMIFLLWILYRSNKIAALLSNWIMNQFTVIPILYMDYHIGLFIIPSDEKIDFKSLQEIILAMNFNQLFYIGKDIFYPMLVGGIICGGILAVITYCVTIISLKIINKKADRENLKC